MLETIRLNSTGDIVKVAKYLTGYSEMKEAGEFFDDDFEKHVKTWQGKNGLTADGIIGTNSWNKIAANAPTCSTSKNTKSAYTCAVQILVGGVTVDGAYGSKTKKAVAAYQSANKLTSDGACGPKTWAKLIGSTSTSGSSSTSTSGSATGTGAGQTTSGGKVLNNCVHYLQWDPRWKNKKYSTHTSSQTIGNSGCGPSSMAMIMATFIDKTITPVEMCKLAVDNGYRTYDNGTAWGFFQFVFKRYEGFAKFVQTSSVETLKAALKDGALAVCSMNSNDNCFWTKGGHFITAIGYDSKGYIYANDPNKSSAPRKQLQDKFKSCMKQAFIFWPDTNTGNKLDDTTTEAVVAETSSAVSEATGTKIVDIAKYQGTIDWDQLSPELAFVIIKASGLYKNGADPYYARNVAGAVSHGVPFHAYHFLYCTTEAEAKRDAKLFYDTVKGQGHDPLFWVLDCESGWGIADKSAKAIAELFEAELKRLAGSDIKVAVYIGHNKYKEYALDYSRYSYVWIPRYGSNNGTIDGSIKPSYKCDLWQYTSTGKISGISGNVDMNVITGDGHDLAWFTGRKAQSEAVIPSGKKVQVVNGNVNVRTQPNTDGEIIGVAFNGGELDYGGITADNGWISVIYNGQPAWISGKYGQLI